MGLFSKNGLSDKIMEYVERYLVEGEAVEYVSASLTSYVCITNKRFIIDPLSPNDLRSVTIPFNKISGISFVKSKAGSIIFETQAGKYEVQVINDVEVYNKIIEKIL